MKIKLNLSTAFTLRNRIKKITQTIENELHSFAYVDFPEKKEENNATLTEGSIEGNIALYKNCLENLLKLNNTIDKNNSAGKQYINYVDVLNKQINLFNWIDRSLKQKKTTKSRNPVTGNWEVETLIKMTDYDVDKELSTLTQIKAKMEDELAQNNSSTTFEFELDDKIYKIIYG